MKKNVLVTGNNGVLGRNLVEYLYKNYKDIFNFYLLDIKQEKDWHSISDNIYEFDIRDKSQIEKMISNIDIVVHCASASPAYDEDTIYDIVINGTENLLECSFEMGNVERFIYISSTSVYGIADNLPVLETDEVNPYDPYNKAKILAEKECVIYRDKGHCVPILRPRSFLGPERLGTFAILYEWAYEGRNFPMVGKGNCRYQLLDVDDLCQAIYLTMIGDKEKVNDLFNIGAEEFGTLHQDYQAILDEAGYHKKLICFPVKFMFVALRILEKLKLSPFYKRLYLKLNKDYYVSIDKAKEKLGYQPIYSNKDSLIRNYYWYLENKDNACVGLGNNKLWNQGIFKLVKHLF